MTLHHAAATALLALTTVGFVASAQAEPGCSVTVMGMTFNNGCPTETALPFAPRSYDALRQAHDATAFATTGSIVRRPVR